MKPLKLRKKDFINIIDKVFEDESLSKHLDKEEFKTLYFKHIVKRLKDDYMYKFTREQYQTSIRLYFYYSQEKNIYVILALALLEKRLFDEKCD